MSRVPFWACFLQTSPLWYIHPVLADNNTPHPYDPTKYRTLACLAMDNYSGLALIDFMVSGTYDKSNDFVVLFALNNVIIFYSFGAIWLMCLLKHMHILKDCWINSYYSFWDPSQKLVLRVTKVFFLFKAGYFLKSELELQELESFNVINITLPSK